MKVPQENTQEPQQETVQRVEQESSTDGEATLIDNRPTIAVQRKLRSAMGNSENSVAPIQRKNNTGLPNNLKSGIENLSGYSMDDVKVHYNSSKPAQLQAHAYAQGTDIHLASGQEKHLPHEAWHVVQQKQGRVKPTRQLKSKVNINDDVGLEKEADVMGGKAMRLKNSKEENTFFETSSTKNLQNAVQRKEASDNVIQRKLVVNGKRYRFTYFAWPKVANLQPITGLNPNQQIEAKNILNRWIHAHAWSLRSYKVSENRSYQSWNNLALALEGEVKSSANLQLENQIAGQAQVSQTVTNGVIAFMNRLKDWHDDNVPEGIQNLANRARGRYRRYYGTNELKYIFGRGTKLGNAIENLPNNLNEKVALASDYAMFIRDHITNWNPDMNNDQIDARLNHWNTDEESDWTVEARNHDVPLSAGPSATTALVMTLGEKIGATGTEKEAMAWGLFSFFNQGIRRNYSGTHRFHEVMTIASNYGVPYTVWNTPAQSI